jgi:hypothetical protein
MGYLYVANGGTVTTGTTPPAPTPPSAPTNLTGAVISSSQVNLAWTASSGAAGYDVFRNGSKEGTATSTSFSDTGLPASTSESYYVEAYNSPGTVSSGSNTVTVTTQSTTSPAKKHK